MPVISAPDIVVGIAATRAPVTEATALAVSMTRPPPRATRLRADDRVEDLRRRLGNAPRRDLVHGRGAGGQLTRPGQRPRGREQLEGVEALAGEDRRRHPDRIGAEDDGAAGVAPEKSLGHRAVAARGFTTGRRSRLDLGAQVLEVGRQRELLAEVLERLVDGEARAQRRDLEQHPARLAEVDRPEVEAVDDRGRLGARRDRPLPPPLVLVDLRGPGDVVDAAGALQRSLGRRLVVDVEAAALSPRASQPSPTGSNSSASSRRRLASGARAVGAHRVEALQGQLAPGPRDGRRSAARRRPRPRPARGRAPRGRRSAGPPPARSARLPLAASRFSQKSSDSSEPTRQTIRCTVSRPGPAPRHARELEEGEVGAGASLLVGEEEVVDGRVVLVDRFLDQAQAPARRRRSRRCAARSR